MLSQKYYFQAAGLLPELSFFGGWVIASAALNGLPLSDYQKRIKK